MASRRELASGGRSSRHILSHFVEDRSNGEGRDLLCPRAIIAWGNKKISGQLKGGRGRGRKRGLGSRHIHSLCLII
jgi:hypothetical protein